MTAAVCIRATNVTASDTHWLPPRASRPVHGGVSHPCRLPDRLQALSGEHLLQVADSISYESRTISIHAALPSNHSSSQ